MELKPFPFCGGEAELNESYCSICGAKVVE